MNHYDYFSEIEERFIARRGSILLLSTLDWALIETWREAGIPLEAVLRGIDAAFDKYEARSARAKGRLQKVNGLAWCAQAVMAAAEQQVEAATGMAPTRPTHTHETGFEHERVARFLDRNAAQLAAANQPDTAARLTELAVTMRSEQPLPLEDLDRTLTVLEEKLIATLTAAASEATLTDLRAQADRELAPHRSRLNATQLRQIHAQFLARRLFELHNLPRLSLFYMGHES